VAILDRPLPRRQGRTTAPAPRNGVRVECRNLHLAYDNGRRPALSGVDLTLAPGKKIALVGASGAGKSTLLHLILGFLSPDRGDIRVNGTPLPDLSLESWHREVAWIGQQPVLFYGTIRGNIRMGRPDASDEMLFAAARAARVLEFTDRMPSGLDTAVGERGAGLSRGQAQRVALARAFLKDAPVILLDEPTAGLDRESEARVMAALDALAAGRTLLMATHRLATLENADQILVLDRGRVIEAGTYTGLTARKGAFDRFVQEHQGSGRHG
jgi:ATP-binding cassette subfamily C protein CydD